MNLRSFLLFLSGFVIMDCQAQTGKDSASSTAAGTKPFRQNGSKTFWMGSNYRKEWNTKVTVPVIDLSTAFGGLTPVKKGGGKQTRSLRMEDPNGREYSLRSVQKFITSKTLPGDLQSEAAADLVADGVSASYPYSNLSIGVLSEAAGIPSGQVKLVYIGDDPKLGEFRAEFSNMLALLEIRLPDSVKKGHDTEDVAKKLKDDNDNQVDQLAVLRARILDMFVMDLDRHEDQWQWGVIEKEKGKIYYPIPRDRDQAFYINQGVIPGIVKWPWLVPQLQGFRAKSKNIRRFNWAARNFDRFFLTELSEEEWRSEAEKFVSKMTDEVIEKSIAQQPPEIVGISGPKIIETLKKRRNYLVGEVMDYYDFLAEDVNITASDKKEHFDVTLNDDGSVLLKIFKITNEGNQGYQMYERLFDPKHTKEIRIYGFGGDDRYTLTGKEDKIKIRMIGGEGADTFENVTSTGETGIVYDRKDENNIVKGDLKVRMKNDTISHYYNPLGYNYNNTIPFIAGGYNQDDGVFVGALLRMFKHGFRKDPYKNSHNFLITHAFSTGATRVAYAGEFISTFGRKTDLLIGVDINAPNATTNFFGYGMNSVYDKTKPGEFRYYRARYQLIDALLLAKTNFSKKVYITYGPIFQTYDMDENDKFNQDRNITQPITGLDPATAFSRQKYVGGRFVLNIDTRDNRIMPQKGILWHTMVRHLYGFDGTDYRVTQLNSDFTLLLQLIKDRLVIAQRVGGGHNYGDGFEFYQAQYLGTEDNLRGYRKNRFAGRSKLYSNSEVRLRLFNFNTYLFPGAFGVFGFYDTGRVWADTDDTDTWANGYGGDIWLSPLRRIILTFTYAASKEDRMPLVGFSWKF